MEKLKHKLKDRGGFTLIEMLIVVAIIAILIAVSIPLVNSSLERARESTDAANERSFKAVLLISFANGKYDMTNGKTSNFNVDTVYVYDAVNGVITTSDTDIAKYGKSTALNVVDAQDRKGQLLVGCINSTDGKVYMQWRKSIGSATHETLRSNKNASLISPLMVADV